MNPKHHFLLAFLTAAAVAAASCSSSIDSPAAPTGAAAGASAADPSAAPASTHYHVTFQASWSSTTHPDDFPSSAHFSTLVGGTHSAEVAFWSEGSVATDGIKDMAERGLTATLANEITRAIAAGTASRTFTGGNIGTSPGSTTADFDITQTFPRVTLVSMIAPSPDWFVGVSGLPLFENGQWVAQTRIDLVAWDAGTDSGASFASPDLATAPRLPIARILTAPLSPSGRVTPMGAFTFTRQP